MANEAVRRDGGQRRHPEDRLAGGDGARRDAVAAAELGLGHRKREAVPIRHASRSWPGQRAARDWPCAPAGGPPRVSDTRRGCSGVYNRRSCLRLPEEKEG